MSRKMKTMDGNNAAAYASYAFTDVAAIYPITPSSTMAEVTDKWATAGMKNIFGQTVKVVKLSGEGPVRRRIMDMGITKGVEIYVRKVAPLGDPVEVTVRGYELSIRKADAEIIEVQ